MVGNLNFPLGNLEYFKEEENKVIPIEVWIGVGGGVLLIFIIVVIILCWNRHSRRKKSKAIKNLEVQMNNLESKVARECREGEQGVGVKLRGWSEIKGCTDREDKTLPNGNVFLLGDVFWL